MLLNPPSRQPGAINRGGLSNARRVAPAPAPTLSAYYGTGMGQVPLHLNPSDAVMSGADVASIPNSGGAGAAFNATATTTGITRSGNLLTVPSTSVWLNLANAADLVGTRMFFVAALAAGLTGAINFTGRSEASVDGGRANIRWDITNSRFQLQRYNGTAFDSALLPGSGPLGAALHLIELEVAGGTARLFVDGVALGTAAVAWPNLLSDRIFAGHSAPFFTGQAGDVLSVITDGTPARDATMLAVRQIIAAKHGIAIT